jgi:hypothetical protein
VQRFKLQNERELGSSCNFVLDNVPCNLGGQRKRKTHTIF